MKTTIVDGNINEQLKEIAELKEFKNGVAIDFKEALARIIRKQEQIQKLQQCPNEIEGVIKENCLKCSKNASCNFDNCSDLKIEIIKQKIKEVKSNE